MKREIDIDELKLIQLEILQSIHDYCVKSNIKYSLAYGTLIGAIRHKGYIPWDDDVDIMMPREDYERFLDTFNGEYRNLIVFSPEKNKNCYSPYANVVNTDTILIENHHSFNQQLGIKIDIFPIDSVPEDGIKRGRLYDKVAKCKLLIGLKNTKLSRQGCIKTKLAGCFMKTVGHFIPVAKILNQIAIKSNMDNSESELVNNVVWCAPGEKACFKRSEMDGYVDVEFEGRIFKSIVGYDNFLRAHYGDYMKLPPIEERNPKHNFMAYWK